MLAYVDESYSDDWYCMVALLLDGPAAVALSAELDHVVAKAVKSFGLPEDVELHGHEIMNSKGGWSHLPGTRARIGVLDDVVKAVAGQDVRVIARAIDRVGQRYQYPSGYTSHTVVLQHLLERIDECVELLGNYALVIADEVDGQAEHRADLSDYKAAGTRGYRRRTLDRIVDTLHFAPSHASRLVQAADVLAYLFHRVFTHQEADDRAARAKVAMWGRLEPLWHCLCTFPSATESQRHLWGADFRR